MENFLEVVAWLIVSSPESLATMVVQIALVAVTSLVGVWKTRIKGCSFQIFNFQGLRHGVCKKRELVDTSD